MPWPTTMRPNEILDMMFLRTFYHFEGILDALMQPRVYRILCATNAPALFPRPAEKITRTVRIRKISTYQTGQNLWSAY
jgi:hypothetical protein